VEASGGDVEKCNRFGGEDVCTERYEKDGVFACQVRITKMTLAHEGKFTLLTFLAIGQLLEKKVMLDTFWIKIFKKFSKIVLYKGI
jgi:hypothetical protein